MPHQIAKTALHATNENMAAGPPSTINSADADAKDATYLLTESQKCKYWKYD
jgi:hypothetical protein